MDSITCYNVLVSNKNKTHWNVGVQLVQTTSYHNKMLYIYKQSNEGDMLRLPLLIHIAECFFKRQAIALMRRH